MKRCTKCEEGKPFEAFNKERKGRDGLSSTCRECDMAGHAQYYAANVEKERERSSSYSALHPEKGRARCARYYATHKAGSLVRGARRRAAKRRVAVNDFTAIQWQQMQVHYDHKCYYCGKRCKGHLTQEHIIPLSKGGWNTLANIVPACKACNSRKRDRPAPFPVQPLLLLAV